MSSTRKVEAQSEIERLRERIAELEALVLVLSAAIEELAGRRESKGKSTTTSSTTVH